ncbi:DNA internalization-related competence protein ComEC/Rec2 [Fructilactobacillus ixorae]|uniref:DNA internalization-related competence protein ComEC/Rec2 n=1 Tax=Fructilactobacillus ixorae TaxID=1750535 RepID=A0ABY5C3D8_9LACO|nr:DNA internalization-related competence protein ComEC/Rec2 [Fructilactobacillus ixorae]USS92867.1 DNA internalization-related competence protein ComEC/Rec2 [Fructilactobacillus ixorae]
MWTLLVDGWSGSLLTGLWLIRLWRLQLRRFLILNLISLVLPITVGWHTQHVVQVNERAIAQAGNQVQTWDLVVLPDQVVNTKTSMHGSGQLESHQRVSFHGQPLINQGERLHHCVRLRVQGSLTPNQPASNWAAFDTQSFARGHGLSGDLRITKVAAVQRMRPPTIAAWFHEGRAHELRRTNQLPPQLRVYVQSLLFGVRTADFQATSTGFKRLNLIHLFSIAGLHVYVLLNLWFFLATVVRMRKAHAELGAMLLLPLYAGVAGGAIGLVRVILMVEQRYWAKLGNWSRSGLDYWAFALMICVLVNPWLIGQLGFQLSFLLSFTIFYCQGTTNVLKTVMLNLVSLPLLLAYFFEWHWLSIIANLVVVPFFTIGIFPLIISNYLCYLIFKVPIWGTEPLLRWLTQVTDQVASLPGGLPFGQPPWFLVLLLVGTTLLLIESWTWKRLSWLLVLYGVSFLIIHYPLNGEVSFFDVGQGDSILVREPLNRTVTLIDTGGNPNFFARQGQPTIHLAPTMTIPYLKSQGISQLDNLCLSHQDADHIGDLTCFLKTMKVKRVLIPWGMDRNQHFMHKIRPELHNTQLIGVKAGQIVPGTHLRILHPFHPGLGENQDSMVLWGQMGGRTWLFTGDLPKAEERELLQHEPQLRANVLKLGHHGSKTASDDRFIAKLAPQVGIISAGRQNRYGHPNQETLVTMKRHHVQLISTQTAGMIRYRYGWFAFRPKFETKWKDIQHGSEPSN